MQFVTHVGFSYFLNFMVLVSCVVLMLDVVSLDPQTKKAIVLRNLDASITAIFGMEVSVCSHMHVLRWCAELPALFCRKAQSKGR